MASQTQAVDSQRKRPPHPVLQVNKYPMLTPGDLFATLAGGQAFSQLDLTNAYQHVTLEEESRRHVVINTLYRYTRLPFGIASAPDLFQEIMDKIY